MLVFQYITGLISEVTDKSSWYINFGLLFKVIPQNFFLILILKEYIMILF